MCGSAVTPETDTTEREPTSLKKAIIGRLVAAGIVLAIVLIGKYCSRDLAGAVALLLIGGVLTLAGIGGLVTRTVHLRRVKVKGAGAVIYALCALAGGIMTIGYLIACIARRLS